MRHLGTFALTAHLVGILAAGCRGGTKIGDDAALFDGAQLLDGVVQGDGSLPGDGAVPVPDAVVQDGTVADAAQLDAGSADAGPQCGGGNEGWCPGSDTCFCCPIGGPMQACLCSTTCTDSGDCDDPSQPECEIEPGRTSGFCRPSAFSCCWLCN